MFGKVKRWLGIEGVKLELEIPEEIYAPQGYVEGSVRFYSMHEQIVTRINIVLIEKFKRGRRKNKRIDEYKLGQIELNEEIIVPEHEEVSVEFNIPYELALSDMDKMEGRNFLLKGLIKSAKVLKGVKSEYRIEAEAQVKGTALNPFDRKVFDMIQ